MEVLLPEAGMIEKRKKEEGLDGVLHKPDQTSSVADTDRIDFGRLGPDPGEQKDPQTIEKSEEISCFEVLYVFFFLGLKASRAAWASFMKA
jgi:hypothetical protein